MSFKNILPYFFILLIAAACGNKNQQGMQAPPAVTVSVLAVSTGDAAYYDEYPAVVRHSMKLNFVLK